MLGGDATATTRIHARGATHGEEGRTLDSLAETSFNGAFQSVETTVIVHLRLEALNFVVLSHQGHVAGTNLVFEHLSTQSRETSVLIRDNRAEGSFKLLRQHSVLRSHVALEFQNIAVGLAVVRHGLVTKHGAQRNQISKLSTSNSSGTTAITTTELSSLQVQQQRGFC